MPCEGQVYTCTYVWEDHPYIMLVRIDQYPMLAEDSPFDPEINVVRYSYPDFDNNRQKFYWQGCVSPVEEFLAGAKPTTKADWILYADKNWHHFEKEDRFILASD